MALRVAFVGFRHGHIFALYNLLKDRPGVDIVAACEEDPATRASLPGRGVSVTHDSYETLLDAVDCDVVACGDYFGVRGARIVAALERGRHVVGDKPLCTRLDELDRIEALARANRLSVGCMLDLCDSALFQTLRRLLASGAIGDVQAIHFNGQHPLLYGTRPLWYFEQGKHGGTINDIAIHALDGIPWLTGHPVTEITAARVWNAKTPQHPEFQDGGMLMLRLANGCGVLGDVSYLSPDRIGYTMPAYWRMTFYGSEGFLESAYNARSVTFCRNDGEKAEEIPLDAAKPGGYFDDFAKELEGKPDPDGLTTDRVFRSSRIALLAQQAAENGTFPLTL